MVLEKKKFKQSYNNHIASYRNKSKEKSTEFAINIWKLENSSINYDFKWSIVCKAYPYTDGTRKCDLCLTEKLAIIKADPESLFNTLDEFVSKCRHMNKFTLRFFKKK